METRNDCFKVLLVLFVVSTTMTQASPCEDAKPNCNVYNLELHCKAPYIRWAVDNCKKSCNLCDTTHLTGYGNCRDHIPSCQDHVKMDNVCNNPKYQVWARNTCKFTCGVCSLPPASEISSNLVRRLADDADADAFEGGDIQTSNTLRGTTIEEEATINTETTTPTSTLVTEVNPHSRKQRRRLIIRKKRSGGCYDNVTHKTYRQGETWVVDCKVRYTCDGGWNQHITGRDLCWSWKFSKPSECYMNPPKPGKCCPTPWCPSYVKINYPAGYKEE